MRFFVNKDTQILRVDNFDCQSFFYEALFADVCYGIV